MNGNNGYGNGRNGNGAGELSKEELKALFDERPDTDAPSDDYVCQLGECERQFCPTVHNVVVSGRVKFAPEGKRLRVGAFMVVPAWPIGNGRYCVDGEGPLQVLAVCRPCQKTLREFFRARGGVEREFGHSFSYEHAQHALEERRRIQREEEGESFNPLPLS